MYRSTRGLAVVAVVAGLALAGCASDDAGDDTTGGETTAEITATTPSSVPVPGPGGGQLELPGPAVDRWTGLGGPDGELGPPTGPATEVEGGSITEFERGVVVVDPTGRAFVVQGRILDAYLEAGGPDGELGFPTSDEITTDGGWITTFEHGTVAFLDGEAVVEVG